MEDDGENSFIDQVKMWKQIKVLDKDGQPQFKYFLIFNLHRLE